MLIATRINGFVAKRAMRLMMMSTGTVQASAHKNFIENIAKTTAPARLDALIELLSLSGEEIIDPSERNKRNLNPFLIPLSKDKDGSLTCFIRWPTQKDTMDLQIVRTTEVGVVLRSLSTDHLARRLVAELDFFAKPKAEEAHEILTKAGLQYTPGDYIPLLKSGKFDAFSPEDLQLVLDRYLLTKIGAFPDSFERLANNFLAKGDPISALITCERAVSIFYGWGHPLTFHARLLKSIEGRDKEARDAAKASLGMPVWTLCGNKKDLEEAVTTAGFSGLKILADMHAFRANDPRTSDIGEGTSPIQVTLDQVAHYMDAVALDHVPGGWSAARDIIAAKYAEGGYPELVDFIKA